MSETTTEVTGIEACGDPSSMMLSGYSALIFLIVIDLFGLVPAGNRATLGILFATIGGIFVVAGLIGLGKGETPTGNLLGTFGFLFMIGPGVAITLSAGGVGSVSPLLGYYILFLSPILFLWFPAFFKLPLMYFLLLPLLGIALIPLGAVFAGIGPDWMLGAAQLLFVIAQFHILYLFLVSTAEIGGYELPLGRPLVTPDVERTERGSEISGDD